MTARSAVRPATRWTGIVVALEDERRCLPGDLRGVHLSGMGPERAALAAETLVAQGAGALLSIGVAGGLHHDAVSGRLVVPDTVLHGERLLPVDVVLGNRIRACAGQALRGCHLAVAEPLLSPRQKAEHAAGYGAVSVDMESGAVATVAARHGLPFAVLRAISDGPDIMVPAQALLMVDAVGRTRPLMSAVQVLRRPGLVPALLRLARGYQHALGALRAATAGLAAALDEIGTAGSSGV